MLQEFILGVYKSTPVPEGVSVNMRGPEKFVPQIIRDMSGIQENRG